MTAPQPNSVTLGFAVSPQDPAVSMIRIETGKARFDVEIPSAEVVGLLLNVAQLAEQQIAAATPIVRPPSGLFLPNGAGVPPMPRNGA
jgi:hypothetical protein